MSIFLAGWLSLQLPPAAAAPAPSPDEEPPTRTAVSYTHLTLPTKRIV